MPTVDVVIPTILRDHQLLTRAVASALDQTVSPQQVLVVVDDPAAALPVFVDERVVVLRNSGARGAAAARNVGVKWSTSDLIGLLDDDDYWLGDKIERQLEVYSARGPGCVVASKAQVISGTGEHVTPERLPGKEALADYLFPDPGLRRSPDQSVLTPTLLIPRDLLLREPFDESLPQWEDLEWLLRVVDLGHELCWAPQTLVVVDQSRTSGPSLSQVAHPRRDEDWADQHLSGRSARAWHNHVLTYAVRGYGQSGERLRALRLIARAVLAGKAPAPLLIKAMTGVVVPQAAYAQLKGLRRRFRSSASP